MPKCFDTTMPMDDPSFKRHNNKTAELIALSLRRIISIATTHRRNRNPTLALQAPPPLPPRFAIVDLGHGEESARTEDAASIEEGTTTLSSSLPPAAIAASDDGLLGFDFNCVRSAADIRPTAATRLRRRSVQLQLVHGLEHVFQVPELRVGRLVPHRFQWFGLSGIDRAHVSHTARHELFAIVPEPRQMPERKFIVGVVLGQCPELHHPMHRRTDCRSPRWWWWHQRWCRAFRGGRNGVVDRVYSGLLGRYRFRVGTGLLGCFWEGRGIDPIHHRSRALGRGRRGPVRRRVCWILGHCACRLAAPCPLCCCWLESPWLRVQSPVL